MRRAARALARARCRRRGAADDSDGGAHRCGGHRLALSMPRAHRYLGSDALCNEFHKVVSWAAHIRDRLRTHRTISRAISSRRSLACGIKLRRVGPGSRRLARGGVRRCPGAAPVRPVRSGPSARPPAAPVSGSSYAKSVVEGSLLWWVPAIRPGGDIECYTAKITCIYYYFARPTLESRYGIPPFTSRLR
jgi:hypothetical protein